MIKINMNEINSTNKVNEMKKDRPIKIQAEKRIQCHKRIGNIFTCKIILSNKSTEATLYIP